MIAAPARKHDDRQADTSACHFFPECGCDPSCDRERAPRGSSIALIERLLIGAIIALAAVSLWAGYSWGVAI